MARASFADLLKAQNDKKQIQQAQKIASADAPPTTTQDNPPPTTTHHPHRNLSQPVSPIKDFTKIPNSVIRNAIPEGLFKGVSKNTYDALYLRTRGAITPTRTIRAKQSDLLMWANVSHNTLKGHLKHLQAVGLIRIHYQRGDNDGADYEVFLPEEITHHPPPPTTHQLPPTTIQKLGGPTSQKLVVGGGYLKPENIEQNDSLIHKKDSIKNDDEAFAELNKVFAEFAERVTGRKTHASDKEKWKALAEVIITELEIAATRTSVSSLPAFAAEHLRRRLLGRQQNEGRAKKAQSNSARVGETPPQVRESFDEKGNLIIKSLTEEGKSENLKTLQEMVVEGFSIDHMQKYFTAEDWTWLMKELEKE